MDNLFCDSNIWIALLNDKDSQHLKARELFARYEGTGVPFYYNNYIDIEILSVLLRKAGYKLSTSWIHFRSTTQGLVYTHVQRSEHDAILQLYEDLKNHKLSFTDISLLYYAKQGCRVLTFDRDLEKMLP
jgi:predicted nucleic acid-binding protein